MAGTIDHLTLHDREAELEGRLFTARDRLIGSAAVLAVALVVRTAAPTVFPDALVIAVAAAGAGCVRFGFALAQSFARLRAFRKMDAAGTQARLNAALRLLVDQERSHANQELSLVDWTSTMPVRLATAPEGLGDHWANIHGSTGGSGPLDLDGTVEGVSEVFTRVPSGRLVVLGPAGAGKSVAAWLFVRGAPDDRAAVVVPVANWNAERGLQRWLVDELVDRCGELGAVEPDGRTRAEKLVLAGRVLPVFDGLDELPKPARPVFLRQLNKARSVLPQLVLTSRTAEYQGCGLVVSGAAAVELQHLSLADLTEYLSRTTSPVRDGGTKWDLLIGKLRPTNSRKQPHRLTRVLESPLMAYLAWVAYSDTEAAPEELLDRKRFANSEEVKAQLLDGFVDARFEGSAPQVKRWLAFLATHLDATGSTQIAWWRLWHAVPRWVLGIALAVPYAGTFAALMLGDFFGPTTDFVRQVSPLPSLAVMVVVQYLTAWKALTSEDATPVRLSAHSRGRRLLAVTATGLGYYLLVFIADRLGLFAYLTGGLPWFAISAVVGLGSVALTLLSEPGDAAVTVTPRVLLRTDRAAAWFGWCAMMPYQRDPLARSALFLLLPVIMTYVWLGGDWMTTQRWIVALGVTGAAMLWYGLLASAWGRFTVARLYLALTDRMPLSVMGFLAEAHRRGVLHQVGGAYEFRHDLLRARLLERAPEFGVAWYPSPQPRYQASVVLRGANVGFLVVCLLETLLAYTELGLR